MDVRRRVPTRRVGDGFERVGELAGQPEHDASLWPIRAADHERQPLDAGRTIRSEVGVGDDGKAVGEAVPGIVQIGGERNGIDAGAVGTTGELGGGRQEEVTPLARIAVPRHPGTLADAC